MVAWRHAKCNWSAALASALVPLCALTHPIGRSQLSDGFLFKELLAPSSELEAFGSEALGAVDWLIARVAVKVVGVDVSTFSLALRDYRTLDGRAANETLLVHVHVRGWGRAVPLRTPERQGR